MRRTIFWLHLALGLALSLYLAVIGVTGSILAFQEELEPWFEPELHRPLAPGPLAPDAVIEAARRDLPGWRPLSVEFPHSHHPTWSTYLIKGRQARVLHMDASGAVLSVHDPKSGFLGVTEQLHANLLFTTRTGRLLNGYGAIGLALLSLSGLALWLWGSRSLKVRWRYGGRALWLDLHQATGVLTLVFLLALAFTGAWFTWSSSYIAVVNRWFARTAEPKAVIDAAVPPMTIAELARRAEQALPGKPIHRISVSEKADQTVRVTMREGEPDEFHKVSSVFLHPRTGAVLHVTRHAERPTGDTILTWLSAVHFGRFGGLPVKLLWFVLGFVLPMLAFTGWLMWLRRVWRRA